MGLASALWPDRIKEPGVNYMEWAFKIPSSAASKIFCYMPEGHCDVTPESVADRIDRYLADPLNA